MKRRPNITALRARGLEQLALLVRAELQAMTPADRSHATQGDLYAGLWYAEELVEWFRERNPLPPGTPAPTAPRPSWRCPDPDIHIRGIRR